MELGPDGAQILGRSCSGALYIGLAEACIACIIQCVHVSDNATKDVGVCAVLFRPHTMRTCEKDLNWIFLL